VKGNRKFLAKQFSQTFLQWLICQGAVERCALQNKGRNQKKGRQQKQNKSFIGKNRRGTPYKVLRHICGTPLDTCCPQGNKLGETGEKSGNPTGPKVAKLLETSNGSCYTK
jgi:hypothetical protein